MGRGIRVLARLKNRVVGDIILDRKGILEDLLEGPLEGPLVGPLVGPREDLQTDLIEIEDEAGLEIGLIVKKEEVDLETEIEDVLDLGIDAEIVGKKTCKNSVFWPNLFVQFRTPIFDVF